MIKQAKVIRAPAEAAVVPLTDVRASADRARVLRKVLADASERAAQVLATAQQRALALTQEAERTAAALRLSAADEGRAQGYAEGLARLALVSRLEAEADQRGLERSVEMARILAERLIGDALASDPVAVAGLAAQALAEVRGARQVKLHANPGDVRALEEHLVGKLAGLSIVADATCGRGDFRVVTDVGTIDANLGVRLDLLSAKLADVLRKGA